MIGCTKVQKWGKLEDCLVWGDEKGSDCSHQRNVYFPRIPSDWTQGNISLGNIKVDYKQRELDSITLKMDPNYVVKYFMKKRVLFK